MIFKMLKKDFRRNRVINITLIIFLVLSAFLMASGTMVVIQLMNSMNGIFEIAKPAHFLQMHSGDINQDKIDSFSQSVTYVENQETIEMLNIDASSIVYEKQGENGIELVSMSGNLIDNGFVIQNETFDYLLDLNNNIAVINNGEVGVPVSYMDTYDLKIGDKVIVAEDNFYKKFIISSFIRDSEMASSMASSTRFLVSKYDHDILKSNLGNLEFIIEYRLADSNLANDFQKIYESNEAEMPTNGQAITYPLIKLLNGLSGGLLATMMILVSGLLIVIAVINLRFTILATLEEEQKEIGTMKAIGFHKKDIRDIYLSKYRVLTIVGCIVGYIIALPATNILSRSITLAFGQVKVSAIEKVLPLLSAILVYILVIQCCKKILKIIEQITVVEALVYEKSRKKKSNINLLSIKKYNGKKINGYFAVRECLINKKSWSLILIIFLLATCIIIIPFNILNTFKSPKFISNMGSAECDLRIDIQFNNLINEKATKVIEELKNDEEISDYSEFATMRYKVKGEEGDESFLIECGDYSKFPISCLVGNIPSSYGEIALSYLNAKKLGLKVGDTLNVKKNDDEIYLKVCGIYQDVTNGGYTAKAMMNYEENEAQKYTVFINANEDNLVEKIADRYANEFVFAKVMPMDKYIYQTLGSMVDSFKGIVVVSSIVGLFIGALIILLFLKLQSVKEYSKCATLKALGFSSNEIRMQYIIQIFICSVLGIILGVVISSTLGEVLVGSILSLTGIGLASFKFIINVPFTFILCPVLLLSLALIITWISQRSIKKYNIIEMIRE